MIGKNQKHTMSLGHPLPPIPTPNRCSSTYLIIRSIHRPSAPDTQPICDRDVPPGASAFSHTELCDAVGERSPRCARLCLCAGPVPARAWAASFTRSLRRSLLSRYHPDATHHTLLARVMVSPQVAGVRIMAGRLFTRLDFLEWF
uniref:Uncharacterized protein n=1 Tax=Rousettus aegyptiacus TaxID=9407 RepID=A0A7J8DIR5_ROUAE|nr:hypothetical protein HJG63_008667 [Rousettus aegyptiacus]